MKRLGMCLNWKVLVGLAIVAMGLSLALSPGAFAAALPFLLAVTCPLSMLLMTHGNHGLNQEPAPQPGLASAPVPVQVIRRRR